MHLTVRAISGRAYPLSLPAGATPAEAKSALATASGIPEEQQRLFSPSSRSFVSDSDALPSEDLRLVLRLRGGGKKRCQHNAGQLTQEGANAQCRDAAVRLVGECPHCKLQFCAQHRLPEQHKCSQQEQVRHLAFQANKQRLEAERTAATHGLAH